MQLQNIVQQNNCLIFKQPEENMKTASWVIVENATNNALFETFNPAIADKINRDKYSAVPILQYLQALNKSLKG